MNQPNQKPMNPFGSTNMINIQANDGRPTQLMNQQSQINGPQSFVQGQNLQINPQQDQQYANMLMQLLQGTKMY